MARARAYNPRKREWESSLGEEDRWMKLARTVPAILMRIGTSRKAIRSTMKAISAMKDAKRGGEGFSDHMRHASEHLDGAHDTIARLIATHAEAGHVFVHCAAHLGDLLGGAGAPWQAWKGHRADAVLHARDARWWLCRSGGAVEAALDVCRVVEGRSGSGRPREAERLLRRARDDVSKALHALMGVRHAIVLEFFDAWMVLNQNR
uniref:Uncharacterized protein n=1 Tax=Oryza punctata TaxID=4537 RepID=A0A0E0JEA0_ORYPU